MTVQDHSTFATTVDTNYANNVSRAISPTLLRAGFDNLNDTFNNIAEADIASATATNICTLGANVAEITITGTTTITSFSAPSPSRAGVIRFVTFSGALTLTHSASLYLPGAANITTAANDRCIMVFDGTNWLCQSYTKATGKSVIESVDTTGTPANNQVAVFTDADTIERPTNLVYDGTGLSIGATAQDGVVYAFSSTDAALSSTAHAITAGSVSSENISIGNNIIQARNNGAAEVLSLNEAGGGVGIGTATVPHGAVGSALVAIEGAATSIPNGPNMQFTTATDNYPLVSTLNYAHDTIYHAFDAYHDGSVWKSSDAGSNFMLVKTGDTFTCQFESGVAQGSTITWSNSWQVESTGKTGFMASTTTAASIKIAHGTAPTSPTDGDMWTTTAGLYVRINGSTVGPLS